MAHYLYQGKPVYNMRPASQKDKSSAGEPDQVIIMLEDGTDKTVNRSEVRQK